MAEWVRNMYFPSAGFQQPEAQAHPHAELCPGTTQGLQGGRGAGEGEWRPLVAVGRKQHVS